MSALFRCYLFKRSCCHNCTNCHFTNLCCFDHSECIRWCIVYFNRWFNYISCLETSIKE